MTVTDTLMTLMDGMLDQVLMPLQQEITELEYLE